MLDPWIIEEIRRREEEERHQRERPVVEIPLEAPVHPGQGGKPSEDTGQERGVVIVDFCV
ncbi:MAG: hypothetical protein ACHQ17_10265 [Polyangia bacterium]|jgi:hypothetical protein